MNFYKLDLPLIPTLYFLDLNYTTQEDGVTWHWFLCLNNGSKHSFQQLTSFERIEYKDIPQSQISETP